MTGFARLVKSKQGLITYDRAPLVYADPDKPPVTQHFVPPPALVIKALEGVPNAQSLPVPPLTQLPVPLSKP